MICGCIFMVPSLLIAGPSQFLGLNDSIPLIFVGQLLIGMFGAFIYPIVIPELVEQM